MAENLNINFMSSLNPNQNPESTTLTYTATNGELRIKDLGTLLIFENNYHLIEIREGSIPKDVNKKDIIFPTCSTTGYLNDNHTRIIIHKKSLEYIPLTLADALGLQNFQPLKLTKSQLSDTKKYYLPSVTGAINHYNAYVEQFEKKSIKCKLDINDNEIEFLSFLISLMVVYDHFASVYSQYHADSDEKVDFRQDITAQSLEDTFGVDPTKKEKIEVTDIKCIIHLFLCVLEKNPNEIKGQRDIVINSRLKTVCNTLSIKEPELFVERKNFETFFSVMQRFPKLKKFFFKMTMINKNLYPELALANKLLAYSGMSSIHNVQKFLYSEKRVIAHRDPQLFSEIKAYIKALTTLQKELGEGFLPYLRFLSPNNQTLNSRQFPNLFVAARAFAIMFKDSKMANIKLPVKPTTHKLEYKAITIDNDFENFSKNKDLIKGTLVDPEMQLILEQFNYDKDKISAPDYKLDYEETVESKEWFSEYRKAVDNAAKPIGSLSQTANTLSSLALSEEIEKRVKETIEELINKK